MTHHHDPSPPRPSAERGLALAWTVFCLFLVSSFVVTGLMRMNTVEDEVDLTFAVEGQAWQVAESGLVDALAWLRRQPAQPVRFFRPQLDPAADPPIDETDDPSLGLVREFEISPGIWGRYVVRQGSVAEDFVDTNGNGLYDVGEAVYDADGDGRRTLAHGARDTTDGRSWTGAASVWLLEAEGSVYRRPRADLPLDQDPNQRIGRVVLSTEVRRGAFSFVAHAAIVAGQGKDVKVEKNTRIVAPDVAIAYRKDTGTPNIDGSAIIEAPVAHAAVEGWDPLGGSWDGEDRFLTVEEVFGVDWATLRAMADVGVGWADKDAWEKPWKKDRIPYTIPEDALVVVNAQKHSLKTVKFDDKYPLRGRGIVAIDAKKTEIKKHSNSTFRGILFIEGDLKIEGPCDIQGTILCTGKVEIKGKDCDVNIVHDPDEVARQVGLLGQYRRSKTVYVPCPRHPDDRPAEQPFHHARFGRMPVAPPPLLPSYQIATEPPGPDGGHED